MSTLTKVAMPAWSLFSDGSWKGGKVGAAAILCRPGLEDIVTAVHIPALAALTSQDSEMIALVLGLHMLDTALSEARRCPSRVTVYSDNTSALAVTTLKRKISGRMVKPLQECVREMALAHPSLVLSFQWTPGHGSSRLSGMEKADQAAGEAASGASAATISAPPKSVGRVVQ